MNVKGLSIQDIMNIDLDTFNKLNESELRHITSRLVSAGNKRIRRLKEKEINSPALQGLGKEQTFSTKLSQDTSKQQRVNKLRQEFARARNFLTSETSTITGYKNYSDRTTGRIAKELNIDKETLEDKLGKNGINKLFNLHHWAQQNGYISSYRKSKGSLQGRNVIAEILIDNPDASEEDIKAWFENTADALYKDQQKKIDIEDETEESNL